MVVGAITTPLEETEGLPDDTPLEVWEDIEVVENTCGFLSGGSEAPRGPGYTAHVFHEVGGPVRLEPLFRRGEKSFPTSLLESRGHRRHGYCSYSWRRLNPPPIQIPSIMRLTSWFASGNFSIAHPQARRLVFEDCS